MIQMLVISLCMLAQTAPVEPPDPARLPGAWQGQARFYEVKLRRAMEPPAFKLSIAPDLTLTGTVGTAQIGPARPAAIGTRIDYKIMLDGPVASSPLLGNKTHLIILVTAVGDDTFSADFHLKSRFGFDISMHPGSLEAVRMHGQ